MRLTVVTFNYLKKYTQREIAKATGVSVYKPFQGRWRDVRKKRWYYDENRPWTDAAKAANAPMKRQHHHLLEPISNEDWSIFKGDRMSYSTDASQAGNPTIPEGVLLGLGNPLLDITVYTNASFLQRYDLEPNNAIIATEKHQEMFHDMVENMEPAYLAGGATQNSIRVAQWLLQRQHATTFFGGVGDDKFRHILEDKAAEVGVKVIYQVHAGERTGVCGAIITGEDRSLVSELGAAELFTEDFLHQADNWSYVEKAQFYYIGGFVLPVSPQAVMSVARHCARHRKTLVMNLHATFLATHFVDRSLGLMQYIDILFGNGDEAAEYSKQAGFQTDDIKEMALKTAALPKVNNERPRIVVFTRGKQSTIIAMDGKIHEIPVEPIDPSLIVDTNGCGDSFVGGFLSQLAQGRSVDDCVRCGSYAAKVVIQNYGCSFPPKPEFS